jgi:hypothetical protein
MTVIKGYNSGTSAWEPVAVGADITNTLTTKGDLLGRTSSAASRLGVGSNNQVLTADSAEATGLKWATPAAGGMTLISTTSLTGASTINITSIPATYNNLQLVIQNYRPATDGNYVSVRVNNDSTANRYRQITPTDMNAQYTFNSSSWPTLFRGDQSVATGLCIFDFPNYANTTTRKSGTIFGASNDATTPTLVDANFYYLFYNQTSAISEINLFTGDGNFTSGTALLYGVK